MRRFWLICVPLLLATCSGSSATTTSTEPPARMAPSTSRPPDTSVGGVIPNEAWLIFAWYPDVLHLVRADGSERQRLELGVPGVPFAPAWSADGEQIIFVLRGEASSTPNGALWTANLDGSHAALYYDGNGECDEGAYWPSWSPDGARVALVCYHVDGDVGFSEIAVLDTATMTRTDLVTLTYPDAVDNPPSWSPDSSTLAFEAITWDPTDTFLSQSVVATVPVAGGPMTTLTEPAMFAAHPDWSPDGSLIAFNTYDTGNMHGIGKASNVYTIAPDGTGLHQLSTASIDGKMRLGQPFWSADGSRIWVSVARDFEKDSTGQPKNTLAWVDAATGELHEIGTEGKRFRERPTQ